MRESRGKWENRNLQSTLMPVDSPNIRSASEAVWKSGFIQTALLNEGDVFVLRSNLNLPAARLRDLAGTLSQEEVDRAARFKFDLHRNRFVASHGLLREILGRLMGVDPVRIRFAMGGKGKPHLGGEFSNSDLKFNLSKSEDKFALAITRSRKVGVDIEIVQSNKADAGVAETHFSKREREDLESLQGNDWEMGFFNCWTRKEAFIKATGEGLYRPLDSFDVALVPGEPAELRSVDGSPANASHWKLLEVPYGEGCAGAVIAEGRDWNLTCWDYPS